MERAYRSAKVEWTKRISVTPVGQLRKQVIDESGARQPLVWSESAMNKRDLTRRGFVRQSLATVAPGMIAANSLPLVSAQAEDTGRMSVVCVGGHPDDPESGCGGTLARYAALGHAVTVVYLTRGERGISGKSLDDAARIRSAECEAACKIMGAKPVFFGQIDGATERSEEHTSELSHSQISYAVFCLKKKKKIHYKQNNHTKKKNKPIHSNYKIDT